MTTQDRVPDPDFMAAVDKWREAYEDFKRVCDRFLEDPAAIAGTDGKGAFDVGRHWEREYSKAWKAMQEAFFEVDMYAQFDQKGGGGPPMSTSLP